MLKTSSQSDNIIAFEFNKHNVQIIAALFTSCATFMPINLSFIIYKI